jgi:hypothetical protein
MMIVSVADKTNHQAQLLAADAALSVSETEPALRD